MLDPTAPALLLLCVGLLLAGAGLLRRRRQAGRAARAWSTTGTVVDEVPGFDGVGGSWLPVVAFTAPDGTPVTGVPRSSAWHGVSRIGREVTVHADHADPRRFEVLAGVGGRAGSVLLLGSAPFLAVGLAGLLLR